MEEAAGVEARGISVSVCQILHRFRAIIAGMCHGNPGINKVYIYA